MKSLAKHCMYKRHDRFILLAANLNLTYLSRSLVAHKPSIVCRFLLLLVYLYFWADMMIGWCIRISSKSIVYKAVCHQCICGNGCYSSINRKITYDTH